MRLNYKSSLLRFTIAYPDSGIAFKPNWSFSIYPIGGKKSLSICAVESHNLERIKALAQ